MSAGRALLRLSHCYAWRIETGRIFQTGDHLLCVCIPHRHTQPHYTQQTPNTLYYAMPKFSTKSKQILASVHPDLRRLFETVVERFDCTIVSGHRNEAEQNEKFRQGLSKVQYPDSKHNAYPSNAVDVAPYPIDWEDRERFAYFAGYVMGVAQSLGITIRWGGDFDMDTEVKDSTFYDGGHFELKD